MIELIHGDSAKVLSTIKRESIDLVVTSPPYDINRTYDIADYFTFDSFKQIANKIIPTLSPGGVIVWVVGDQTKNGTESGSSFKQALYFKEAGLRLHDTMIWKKSGCPFPDTTRYYQNFEYMFVFSKGRPRVFNPIMDRRNKWAGTLEHGTERQKDGSLIPKTCVRNKKKAIIKEFGVRYNIWDNTEVKTNKFNHPAPFPESLARDHILSWSNKGDTVLDPFVGSGTTAVAAKNLERDFIGIDLNPNYIDIAKKRIDQ